MIAFRKRPEMFVAYPRNQIAHYTDLTMPKRSWHPFDAPTCSREFLTTRFREQKHKAKAA